MSTVLVIGRSGQLARCLAERAGLKRVSLSFAARPELDLTNVGAVRGELDRRRPQIIINTAAYTKVDAAEDDPRTARRINAEGPAALADAAQGIGARLIHVSTDYVFDGDGEKAWREDDPTGPKSVYGQTKLEGESAIRASCPAHAIVRTAWLYSPFGSNFVRTMLSLARTRSRLRVVGDQTGNPTSALDLADGLLAIIDRWKQDPGRGLGGTYHLAAEGATDWADFAKEIFAISRTHAGPTAEVEAITSADWPAKAPRPHNSRLDSSRYADVFGFRCRPWQDALADVVPRLVAELQQV